MRRGVTISSQSRVQRWVSGFLTDYRYLWDSLPYDFPSHLRHCTQREQRDAARRFDEFLDRLSAGADGVRSEIEIESMKSSIRSYMVGSIHGKELPSLERFIDCADEFLDKSRAFDPGLPVEDIHQAIRNVWIVNSIQVCLDRPVRLTPSAFAYSLLYPYTDNTLDDPGLPLALKLEFLREVRGRLLGDATSGSGSLLRRVFRLIGMIEEEYPRQAFPRVFESLLAIHTGQERSILEQNVPAGRDGVDILQISLEKGGTSVLADACLTAGDLSTEMAKFSFGFGAALQLIDDLQDLDVDGQHGHETIFSGVDGPVDLERRTNRLFAFVRDVLSVSATLFPAEGRELSEVSRSSCYLLMFESIARLAQRYRPEYMRELERFSPLRFDYLSLLHTRLKKRFDRLHEVSTKQRSQNPKQYPTSKPGNSKLQAEEKPGALSFGF